MHAERQQQLIGGAAPLFLTRGAHALLALFSTPLGCFTLVSLLLSLYSLHLFIYSYSSLSLLCMYTIPNLLDFCLQQREGRRLQLFWQKRNKDKVFGAPFSIILGCVALYFSPSPSTRPSLHACGPLSTPRKWTESQLSMYSEICWYYSYAPLVYLHKILLRVYA